MRQFLQTITRISQSTAMLSFAMRNMMRMIVIAMFGMVMATFSEVDDKYYAYYSADGITLGSYTAENTSGFASAIFVPSHQTIPSGNDSFFEDSTDEDDKHHTIYPSSTPLFYNTSTRLITSCHYTSTSPFRVIPLYILFHSWQHYI
ncbi:MAG: hypothetical protein ACK6DA_09385 [Candidatus Kapaibacterium sp.]